MTTEQMILTQQRFEFRLPMGNGCRERQPLSGKFTIAHQTDDSLRRLAKHYRRALEDVREGDLVGGKRRERLLEAQICDIEGEEALRAALREHWLADPWGCDSTAGFMREGPDGDGPLVPLTDHGPSYRIAILFDYERHLRGESTVLTWETTAPEGSSRS